MDTDSHTLNTLFKQLGLPNSDKDIAKFIAQHRTETGLDPLEGAPFWSPNQAHFIQEALEEDSDWCEVVDELNALLHS